MTHTSEGPRNRIADLVFHNIHSLCSKTLLRALTPPPFFGRGPSQHAIIKA